MKGSVACVIVVKSVFVGCVAGVVVVSDVD